MDDLKNLDSDNEEADPEERRKRSTRDNFHPNGQMTLNKNKLFDKTCSICTDDYQNGEIITITPCKHAFHDNCIQQWIDKNIYDQVKEIRPENGRETFKILEAHGPECPNCNWPLINKAPANADGSVNPGNRIFFN